MTSAFETPSACCIFGSAGAIIVCRSPNVSLLMASILSVRLQSRRLARLVGGASAAFVVTVDRSAAIGHFVRFFDHWQHFGEVVDDVAVCGCHELGGVVLDELGELFEQFDRVVDMVRLVEVAAGEVGGGRDVWQVGELGGYEGALVGVVRRFVLVY